MKELKNKNCFITGAASGIGRSFALALAKEGMNLFITDINIEKLEDVKKEIEEIGVKVIAGKCDVSKIDDFEVVAKNFFSEFENIDLLINNAGISIETPLDNIILEDWKKVIDVNLWSIIYSLKVFLTNMLERRSGHIVNVASGAGILGTSEPLSYITSKFGVTGISEGLFGQLAAYNIKVSVIIPSYIKTNIFFGKGNRFPKKLLDDVGEEKLKEIAYEIRKEMYDKSISPDRAVKKYIAQIKKDQLYVYNTRSTVLPPLAIKGTNPKQYEEFLININKIVYDSRKEIYLKYGINIDNYYKIEKK
jgi:3-oxoacyl-[acyl-carrier protein] reductase